MKIFSCLCLLSILLVVPCLAQRRGAGRKPASVSVRQHPDYAQLPVSLKELVAQKAKKNKNTFYVARIDVGHNLTDVYWKEENTLILLEPVNDDWRYALLWSRRYWEYDKDVVPTLKDVGGSNYLLTRADWRRLVANCLRGDKFIVYREQRR